MKKRLLVLVVALLCACGLFAANYQKIYDIDSPVYEAIKYLFINQGHALPSIRP